MPEHSAWSLAEQQLKIDKEKREILDRELRDHLNDQQFVLVSDYIEGASREMGVRIDPESPAYRSLARDLMKQWLRLLDRARREDDGEVLEDVPEQPRGPSPAGKVVKLADARGKTSITPPIDTLFDTYLREKKEHVKPTDRQNLQATLRQFVECVGRKAVTAYDVDDMAAFKRALLQYPRDAGKRYPGLPLKKVIEQGHRDKQPVLAANTVRGKLSSLSAFGKWLESNVAGVRADSFSTSLPALGEQEQMEPFDLPAVKRILNSYAFTGCLSKQNHRLPGEFKVRGWQFWLMLIAAFTGARLNEITQLAVTDVRREKGILVFDFRALGANQRPKTTGSTRLLPVHPKLIELGLERVVEAARLAGHADLFHEISIGRDQRRSEKAGRWFDKFLTSLGLKNSRGRAHR
jgi:integrase